MRLDDGHLAWIASCPVAISWPGVDGRPGALVVHGGVDPRVPLEEHTVDDLQNARSLVPGGSYGDRPYWWERYGGPHRVFFGHTVLANPAAREFAVGLDTGCVYGGDLTAYDWYADAFGAVPGGVAADRADGGGSPPGNDGDANAAEVDEADATADGTVPDRGSVGSGTADGTLAGTPAAVALIAEADAVDDPRSTASRDDGPAVEWGQFGGRTSPIAAEPLTEPVESPDLTDPRYYLSRELSELAFQRRVLHEAEDERTPPLTRLRFLSIVTTNMDEFFRKRVGGLKQQVDAGVTERTVDGRAPDEQLTDVLREARDVLDRQSQCFRESVAPALADAGIRLVGWDDLDDVYTHGE